VERSITILDVVLICLTGAFVLALFALRLVWLPAVGEMLEDFGGTLPGSTRLVLSMAFTPGAAMIAASFVALGFWLRRTLPFLLGALVAGGAILLVLWGSYAPIFELAGKIEP
jgi:type II secretory pathway component PulF